MDAALAAAVPPVQRTAGDQAGRSLGRRVLAGIRSPSLWGRTSFLWAAGFVVCGLLALATGRSTALFLGEAAAPHDTYYVTAHFRDFVAVGAAFLAFAAIYLMLERARRGRRRRLLGGLHFAASFLGVNLIFLPLGLLGLGLALAPAPDGVESFFLFNSLVSAGYVLVLVGQGFFVAVLIDAFRREPIVR